jgi:hypothetical protein
MNNCYIKKSSVHGLGLFSNNDYNKGDIIIDDLFPYNYKKDKLLKKLDPELFYQYIIKEGKYINHCKNNYNTDVITDDYINYKLIATKEINKDDELLSNYDKIHNNYNFIAGSKKTFNQC